MEIPTPDFKIISRHVESCDRFAMHLTALIVISILPASYLGLFTVILITDGDRIVVEISGLGFEFKVVLKDFWMKLWSISINPFVATFKKTIKSLLLRRTNILFAIFLLLSRKKSGRTDIRFRIKNTRKIVSCVEIENGRLFFN